MCCFGAGRVTEGLGGEGESGGSSRVVRGFGLEAEAYRHQLSYSTSFVFASRKLLLLTNITSEVMSSGSDSPQP